MQSTTLEPRASTLTRLPDKKASRWLDLVAFLLGHRFAVTREEIFRKVAGYDGAEETARRKFERDKAELRELGINIDTVELPDAASDEPAMGYRLRPNETYLPYLELVDEPSDSRPYAGLERILLSRAEVDVLDVATRVLAEQGDGALAQAAASARRKLAFDLPLSSDSARRVLAAPLPAHVRETLAVLQNALIDHVAVSCRYVTRSHAGEAERILEPWALFFQMSRWYCVARPRDLEEPQLFRVDRLRDARPLAEAGARVTVPDDFNVRTFAGRPPWEFGSDPMTLATVRFAFPESQWLASQRVGETQRVEDDQSAVLRFRFRDRDAFTRWLLSFGRQADVVEPEWLRASISTLRADVAALYAEAVL